MHARRRLCAYVDLYLYVHLKSWCDRWAAQVDRGLWGLGPPLIVEIQDKHVG